MKFSKAKFEYELIEIRKRNEIVGYWTDVTDYISAQNPLYDIKEYIYSISTQNPSAHIIIFSSIDFRNNLARDKGADAIRLVYQWKTSKGLIYSRIRKRLRVVNVFSNLEETLIKACNECFSLNSKDWGTLEEMLKDGYSS